MKAQPERQVKIIARFSVVKVREVRHREGENCESAAGTRRGAPSDESDSDLEVHFALQNVKGIVVPVSSLNSPFGAKVPYEACSKRDEERQTEMTTFVELAKCQSNKIETTPKGNGHRSFFGKAKKKFDGIIPVATASLATKDSSLTVSVQL